MNETDRSSNATVTDATVQDVQKSTVPIQSSSHQSQQLQKLTTTTTTANNVNHLQQQQQTQHHSNIILVRGARTENGQIILQNSHDLLNLLNDEEKPLLVQHSRLKTKPQNDGTFLLQSALKGGQIDGTVLLQSTAATVKKSTSLPEGSIIVQQRLNKNGQIDGPILLQTLKRLDKSQSILVFRNPTSGTITASTSTAVTATNTIQARKSGGGGGGGSSSSIIEDVEEKSTTVTAASKQLNTPLGSGKYI